MHEKNEYPMKVNGSVSLSSKLRSHMPRLSRAALPCQIPGMAANGMGVWAIGAGSGGEVGAGAGPGAGEGTGDDADAGAAEGIGAGVGVSAGGAALSAGGAVAFGGSAAGAGEIGAAGAGALTCSLFRCAARTACRW